MNVFCLCQIFHLVVAKVMTRKVVIVMIMKAAMVMIMKVVMKIIISCTVMRLEPYQVDDIYFSIIVFI